MAVKNVVPLILFVGVFLPHVKSALYGNVTLGLASSDDICPTWTHHDKNSSVCECGDNIMGAVHCDKVTKQVSMLIFYCMSYSEDWNRTVAGCCPYTNKGKLFIDGMLYPIPNETSKLDSAICGPHNRTGQMCGSCREGYAPPVYSYSLACVECSDYKYNWLKYLAVAYLPLTVFYFIVIFFRINISSPSMSVYVLISQLVGIPPVLQLISQVDVGRGMAAHHGLSRACSIGVTGFYGLWNLDFLRVIYNPFCLHPKMTTLQVLMLDYAIAVYPMCLVVITYILFKLHFHYSAVVWLWTPFRRCFSYFRKEWDLSNSLVGAFGTFLLLSYMKILYTSFSILVPTTLHDMNREVWIGQHYVLYDGTVPWFGRKHLPYAIPALIMSLLFNFLPLFLLLLYPCLCFHKCLNRCRLPCQLLHVLTDTILGAYKLKPKDCRYFAAIYLLVRIGNLTLFLSILYIYDYFIAAGSLLLFCTFVVAVTRPYKRNIHNVFDTAMLLVFAYTVLLFSYMETIGGTKIESESSPVVKAFSIIIAIGVVIPPLYVIGLLLYGVVPRKLLLKLESLFEKLKRSVGREETEPLLPYRLEHPEEYAPILSDDCDCQ